RIAVFSRKERLAMTKGPMFADLKGEIPEKAAGASAGPVNPAAALKEEKEIKEAVLNPRQLEAVKKGPGPVLVLAGPGTGKTQTLLGRIQRLMQEGVSPRQVLAVTFTRRAAKEMKERLGAEAGNRAVPQAETLHAMAFEYWQQVHNETPIILADDEAKKLFARANPELKGQEFKREWERYILAREGQGTTGDYGDRFTRLKRDRGLVEYADLLDFWCQEIESGNYIRPFTHVLVDEVQDLSRLQLKLVSQLVPENGHGFFAIGDPKQSIYSFRGAERDVRGFLEEIWPGLKVVGLEENYRSAQKILDYSVSLFPAAEALHPRLEREGEVRLFQAKTDFQENSWITDRIKELIGGTAHWQADMAESDAEYLAPGEVAVLVRFKALIPGIAAAMKRSGVPCATPEEEVFFREPRVALILRTAARMLGMAEEEDVLDCPEKILAEGPSGLAVYLRDIPPFDLMFWEGRAFARLKEAYERHGGWAGVLNEVHLENELDAVREKAQKVRVMTMHAAKGLEFEAVFIPALEDGLLPLKSMDVLLGKGEENGEVDEKEERRLLYVALTRARSRLFLSHAASRKLYGRTLRLHPSRFLKELPTAGVRITEARAHKKKREKAVNIFAK
ncbi:MAG: ATP-dependent helicase, partial [Desulfonatronovibrionaceae bacterium]